MLLGNDFKFLGLDPKRNLPFPGSGVYSNLLESLQYIALCRILIPPKEASYFTASFIVDCCLCILFYLSSCLWAQFSPSHLTPDDTRKTRMCVPDDSKISLYRAIVWKNFYLINTTVPKQIFTKSVSELVRRALAPITPFNLYLLA